MENLVNQEFWSGKRVLITGHTGFKGSWLGLWLSQYSADLMGISLPVSKKNYLFNRIKTDHFNHKQTFSDIRDYSSVQKVIADFSPEIIFHMAAQPIVRHSYSNPLETFTTNVLGTLNILEAVRTENVKTIVVNITTDKCYDNKNWVWPYRENDSLGGKDPYAASKAGAEEMCMAYKNTFNMPIIITHTMNVIGERQHPEKYLPKIINCIQNHKKLSIHSNKDKTKPGSRFYIHAQDVADAINFIITKGKINQKYNIVGAKEIDNLKLAKIISNHIGKKLKYKLVDFHSSRPGHDLRYALSGEKLKSMGWKPKKNIEKRILETVSWTIKNREWY